MFEIWKDIVGYEGIYQVSNIGRVRSLSVPRVWANVKHNNGKVFDEVRTRPGRVLKAIDVNGLLMVHLYTIDHHRESIAVKRLVAQAFLPEFDNDVTTASIRHIDTDTFNCSVNNLYIQNKGG